MHSPCFMSIWFSCLGTTLLLSTSRSVRNTSLYHAACPLPNYPRISFHQASGILQIHAFYLLHKHPNRFCRHSSSFFLDRASYCAPNLLNKFSCYSKHTYLNKFTITFAVNLVFFEFALVIVPVSELEQPSSVFESSLVLAFIDLPILPCLSSISPLFIFLPFSYVLCSIAMQVGPLPTGLVILPLSIIGIPI